MLVLDWFWSLVIKKKWPAGNSGVVYASLLKQKRASPRGIAIFLDEDLGDVELAFRLLLRDGVIRRADKQIVTPDEGEEIPLVYVCYEPVSDGVPS